MPYELYCSGGYEEDYEYTVQVPYSYYICNVTLENFNLSHVPVYIIMILPFLL